MRILAHTLFIFILILKLVNIYCDEAEDCTTHNIVSDDGLILQLPYRNESERYQVFFEQIKTLEGYSIEVREYYDGLKNIGVTHFRNFGYDYTYYSYIDSDEFIYTSFRTCSVYNLTYYIENDTPFHIITVDGKPQIATPLNLLSHGVHKNIAYLGSKDRYVRGIPVRQWLACTQLHNTLQYAKIIISYSNPDKWSPVFQKPGYESIPVQIDVSVSKGFGGIYPESHDQFNIFDFKPGPFREELLYVPPGVFCQGRYLEKSFPTIPKSFSFISNIIEASGVYGNLLTFRNEYDLDKHLIKMDYVGNNKEGESRVANLNSKIQYNINKITGSCTISPLTKSQELEFDLFRIDEQPRYEYSGQREIKGVKTDVWITYRFTESFYYLYYEWYFLADGWDSMNFGGPSTQTPFLLIIYDYNQTIYEISDFRENTFNTYNIDLSACRELERKHLVFSITDEKNYETITQNKIAFKEATLIALEKYAKISVVRISKLNIIYDSGVIRPKFTLLDKTNMSSLDHELDLDEAYLLLKAQINNGKFKVTFRDSHKKEITVHADSKSLAVLEQNYAQTVYSNKKAASSGMDEAPFIGLIIAGVFIGILFGVLSGLYYHNRKIKKESAIQMMSLKNPNDNL